MTTDKVKVYTASRIPHYPKWLALRNEWQEIHFTARWPLQVAAGSVDISHCAKMFWEQDYQDVFASDAVLVYGEVEDKLRGALVEAGMGIALGKHVVVVGEHPDYGTWQFHSQVHRVPSLDAARELFKLMAF